MAQPCPAQEWGPLLAAAPSSWQPWSWAGCCVLGSFIIPRKLAVQVLPICRAVPSVQAGGGSLSVIYFVLLLEAIAGQQNAGRQNGAACRWLGENGFDSLNAAKWVGNS